MSCVVIRDLEKFRILIEITILPFFRNSNCPRLHKYKDLGSPTISIVVGNSKLGHALVDLGASINLLPYSVYVELGLGELEPTNITLQLADRSVKIPRGIAKDVLVQLDKIYFPVDFVVLDTQPVSNQGNQFPVILGGPFLAIANAIIHCRGGLMTLSFRNMTVNLNIFNVIKEIGCNTPKYTLIVFSRFRVYCRYNLKFFVI